MQGPGRSAPRPWATWTVTARTEIVAIQRAHGRLVVYKVVTEPADSGASSTAVRALRAARERLAAPASARLRPADRPETEGHHRRRPRRGRDRALPPEPARPVDRQAAFPCLKGVTDVAVLEVDGAPAVLVLSPEEPMLGLMRLDAKGRLTFPRSLPTVGKPICMCVADLYGDGKREVLYVSAQDRDSSIRVLASGRAAPSRRRCASRSRTRAPIPTASSWPTPTRTACRTSCSSRRTRRCASSRRRPAAKFVDVSRGPDYGKGLVQGVTRKSVSIADLKGDGKPTILVASKSFARALRLDDKDRLEIVEQFNGLGADQPDRRGLRRPAQRGLGHGYPPRGRREPLPDRAPGEQDRRVRGCG